jgi:hypothetical protein
MVEPATARGPGESACLERTRSAVLNVLVAAGAGIAVSGWLIGQHQPDALLGWNPQDLQRTAMGALLALVAASYATLRFGSSRTTLRDPALRGRRFFRSRLVAAALGALAVPLGFVQGWFLDSRLEALAPFWVAALGLGFLAVPRGYELDGFDEPIAIDAP